MAIFTNEEVAGKVRGAAAERKWSQAELAAALNLSSMQMSRRMNGVVPFTGEELSRVGHILQTPVATFFGEVLKSDEPAA